MTPCSVEWFMQHFKQRFSIVMTIEKYNWFKSCNWTSNLNMQTFIDDLWGGNMWSQQPVFQCSSRSFFSDSSSPYTHFAPSKCKKWQIRICFSFSSRKRLNNLLTFSSAPGNSGDFLFYCFITLWRYHVMRIIPPTNKQTNKKRQADNYYY